jgi:hypothetical protein
MSKLKFTTTCRVCGQKFLDHALNVPIIGETPDIRTLRFIGALQNHIRAKHPEKQAPIEMLGSMLVAFVASKNFETEDPAFLSMQDQVRFHFHQMTRKTWITDEQIQSTVSKLKDQGFTPENVTEALKEFRQILTEIVNVQPEGAPAPPAETLVA